MLDDAGLLLRDGCQRVPQKLRVVKADARDDACLGSVDDVRRVEAAAQTHLQHHHVARAAREVDERDGAHELELGRMVGQGLGLLPDFERRLEQVGCGDVFAIHADAFLERLEVGAREQARAIAGRLQDGCQVRTGGTLAVRARHMDEPQPVLRATQPIEQLTDAVKSQPRLLPTRLVDVGDGIEHACLLVEGHRPPKNSFVILWRKMLY